MNKYTAVNLALAAGVITVIALLATEAKADTQYSLMAHTVSKHGATFDKMNEVNPGAAIRADFNDDWSVQAGIYKNSYFKNTVYSVGQYTPLHLGSMRLGGFAGLASGYSAHTEVKVGSLSVVAGALAVVDIGAITVGLRAVPKMQPKQAGAVTFEIGYRF
jgi:hypothetical protein